MGCRPRARGTPERYRNQINNKTQNKSKQTKNAHVFRSVLKAIKGYEIFIVMTVKCLAVSVSLKTDKTTQYVQLPPLQCRRGPHGISTGNCSQLGSPAQSGYIRGARGSGRVNQLPQVTRHEAGLPGPLGSWSTEAGTAVSSSNPTSLI